MNANDRNPARPITLFHLIIFCLAYVIGDRCARLLNEFVLSTPIDWLPVLFGIVGILLLSKPALFLLRLLLVRYRKTNDASNPKI
jgi:hypothetical protein